MFVSRTVAFYAPTKSPPRRGQNIKERYIILHEIVRIENAHT